MKVLQLSQIWVYPVKSLGGIHLTSAVIQPKGLQYDRRWMLVNENNTFMTQRQHPLMALFKLSLTPTSLVVKFKGDEIDIPFNAPPGKSIQAIIWDDVVTVHELDEVYNKWFSDRLGLACRLVHFPEENARVIDPDYVPNERHVSLSDGFPFLIIGESSLNDLNSRLQQPILMNRFRPNFVFSGGDPFEEDTWRYFNIGSVKFERVKPCARCVMTTINQEDGAKGSEPLKTLASYRASNNKIYFGQNLISLNEGTIYVGDQITLNVMQEM